MCTKYTVLLHIHHSLHAARYIQSSNSWTACILEVSRHKLESSGTRAFVWYSGFLPPIFPFYKVLFTKRPRVFLFWGFLTGIFKTIVEPVFFKSASRKTVNSIEQKTRVFCQADVQKSHLWRTMVKLYCISTILIRPPNLRLYMFTYV